MLSLGILRLSGINPFTSSESEIGIDFLRKVFKNKDSEDSAGWAILQLQTYDIPEAKSDHIGAITDDVISS